MILRVQERPGKAAKVSHCREDGRGVLGVLGVLGIVVWWCGRRGSGVWPSPNAISRPPHIRPDSLAPPIQRWGHGATVCRGG